MKNTFYAAEIKNAYLRRSYLIAVLPLAIVLYVVLATYALSKELVIAIWYLITYRLPGDARGFKEMFVYAWKGTPKK